MTRPAKRWRLEVEPMSGQRWHSPGEVRMRRAMKALARSYGLRVVVCRAVDTTDHQDDHQEVAEGFTRPAWLAYYHDDHEAGRLPFGEGFPTGDVTCSTCSAELSGKSLLYEWLNDDGQTVDLVQGAGE